MSFHTISLNVPENLYLRLQQAAQATQQPLEKILLRAMQLGSPPGWESVPAEFQADLAALDRLDDDSLWEIARLQRGEAEMVRYQILLDKNANTSLTPAEKIELDELSTTFDRAMLCKAQAAALLKWRGHQLPPAEKL